MPSRRRRHIVILASIASLAGCGGGGAPSGGTGAKASATGEVDAPVLAIAEQLDPAAAELIRQLHGAATAAPENVEARLELAMAYHANAQIDAARRTYEQCAVLDPQQAKTWYLLARTQKDLARDEEALASIELAGDLPGSHPAAAARRGFWLLERGQFADARLAFDRALTLDAQYVNGRIGRARVDLQEGRIDDAVGTLESLRAAHPEDRHIAYLLGTAYRQARRLDEARPLLELGTGSNLSWGGLDPWTTEMEAFERGYKWEYQRAQDYINAQRPDLALPILQKLSDDHPDDVVVLIALSGVQSALRQFDAALAILKRAESIDPKHFAVQLNLGLVYQRLNQLDLALQHTDEAIRLNASLGRGHVQRGQILFMGRQFAEAEASLRRSIELDPGNAQAHLLLVLALDRQGKSQDSVDELRGMIERFPSQPDAYVLLAKIYRGMNRMELVQDIVRLADQRLPGNEQIRQLKQELGLP